MKVGNVLKSFLESQGAYYESITIRFTISVYQSDIPEEKHDIKNDVYRNSTPTLSAAHKTLPK